MSVSGATRIAFRYQVDRGVRPAVMRIVGWITPRSSKQRVEFRQEDIKKILLVSGLFRVDPL